MQPVRFATELAQRHPESYQVLALRAAEQERNGCYITAADLWLMAAKAAVSAQNRAWAQTRSQLCQQLPRLRRMATR